MTAESTAHAAWAPDTVKQKRAGYHVEDVLNLPDDGKYVLAADSDTELVVTSPFEFRLPISDITP